MTSDVLQAQFEAVKAVPLKKPFSEVFTLLQTKAIDGQENTWSNIYSKKFFEVQPYITESNHGVLDYLVVTSAEFWLSLDEGTAYRNQEGSGRSYRTVTRLQLTRLKATSRPLHRFWSF